MAKKDQKNWNARRKEMKAEKKVQRQVRRDRKEVIRTLLVKNKEEGKPGTNLVGWTLSKYGVAVRV